ncbi:hypothetical protein MKW94_014470 [Papaver nudicaule]|uniref:Uncharacterized protein n=1 Tax=Papaver nudicaule TaxID=74823 RepID=A0AA41SLS4_PAPNU|nr:hypothetical protein [Papaver nudicaule]
MLISLNRSNFGSPYRSTYTQTKGRNNNPSYLLPKQLLHCFDRVLNRSSCISITSATTNRRRSGKLSASLLEAPVIWAGRVCIFYALLKAGFAGPPDSPFLSDVKTGDNDLGFSEWLQGFQGRSGEEKDASDKRKLVSNWHPTTKGTLKRSYRVPSKTVGKKLLKAIASLLSDDDHFLDASSHKGCQIRRESAHGESVCCNNVRALFDELPTPHLVVEITAFPAGPLTEKDYIKAEKLEKVLRTGASI